MGEKNEVAMGLIRDEVAEVLTSGMISFYPRRYMAEIEGEHYCKPFLEEGKGWQIKSNEATLLAQALAKCRGHFGEPYAYAVSNILESWKQMRGEWSGLNLSRLDLSKVLINGTKCSRLYKKTYLAARFDESLIPSKFLFPEGHSNVVNRVVYSPDGQKILSASEDETIKEWDVSCGNCLWTYQGHEMGITSAVYSGDGQKILTASGDKTIKEWNVASGTCLQTYQGLKYNVESAAYSGDGQKVLSTSWDKTIKEWDVETGRCLETWNKKEEAPLDDYPGFTNNETFENRFIKEDIQIKIIEHQTKEVLHTLKNIPGLFIQGCSFKNLHPDSQLSDEEKELLKMYGGKVE